MTINQLRLWFKYTIGTPNILLLRKIIRLFIISYKYMNKLTLNEEQLIKWAKNLLFFTAPALVIFFYQLSTGVTFKEALPLAMFALYGLVADYLKKLKQ